MSINLQMKSTARHIGIVSALSFFTLNNLGHASNIQIFTSQFHTETTYSWTGIVKLIPTEFAFLVDEHIETWTNSDLVSRSLLPYVKNSHTSLVAQADPPEEFPVDYDPPEEFPIDYEPPPSIPSSPIPSPTVPQNAVPAIQSTVDSAMSAVTNALTPQTTAGQPHVFSLDPLDILARDNTMLRVINMPATCIPEANSLDCADADEKSGGGANVADQVRSGIYGEVGQSRAATEGPSAAQRQEACTPAPGQLTCAP